MLLCQTFEGMTSTAAIENFQIVGNNSPDLITGVHTIDPFLHCRNPNFVFNNAPNNRFISLAALDIPNVARGYAPWTEGIVLPLCRPMNPALNYQINIDVIAGCPRNLIGVFSVNPPCPAASGPPIDVNASSGQSFNCVNGTNYTQGDVFSIATAAGNGNWVSYPTTINNPGGAYRFLTIYAMPDNFSSISFGGTPSAFELEINLDNIEVKEICPIRIAKKPISEKACIGGQVEHKFEICNTSPCDVTLELTPLPPSNLPVGITYSKDSKNSFLNGLPITIVIPANTGCIPITVLLDVDKGLDPTTKFTFEISGEVENLCINPIDQFINFPIPIGFNKQADPDFSYDISKCPIVALAAKDKVIRQEWKVCTKAVPPVVVFTSMNPDVTLNLPDGIYTIKHTVYDPICGPFTIEKDITLKCQTCDCPTNGNNYAIGTGDVLVGNTPFYNGTTKTLTNACVKVANNGNLILNESYSFNRVKFIMGANAKIKVADKKKITIAQSNLSGCISLWKGIELTPDVTFNFNRDTIADAEKAIDLSSKVAIEIKNNQFRKNVIGINFDGKTPFDNVIGAGITNNMFTCRGMVLLSPRAGEISYAGINTNNVQLNIGNSSALSTNIFRNLQYGIKSYKSIITVINATVDNNGGKNTFTGFYASNSKMIARKCAFKNMDKAIDNFKTSLTTQDITIDNAYDGYYINTPQDVSISGTTEIKNINTGINIGGTQIASLSQPSVIKNTKVWLGNNNYSVGGEVGYKFNNFIGATNPGLFVIRDAIFDDKGYHKTPDVIFGFYLTASKFIKVINNNIKFSSNGTGTGIDVTADEDIRFRENTITETNYLNFRKGFSLANSNEVRFCCNHVTINSNASVDVWGNNKSYWRNNDFNSSFICNTNSSFGWQEDGKNRWAGTSVSARNYALPAFIDMSRIFIDHPNNQDEYWAKGQINPVLVNDPDRDWFQNPTITTAGDSNCDNDIECGSYVERNVMHPTGEDVIIASSQVLPTEFGATADWGLSKRLYNRILTYPNLRDESPTLNEFFERMQSTNIPTFNAIEQRIATLNVLNEDEDASLASNNNWTNFHLQHIENYYNAMAEDSTTVAEYQSQIAYAQHELYKVQLRYNAVLDEVYTSRLLTIDSLKALNATIHSNLIWEQNQQKVNEIYLNTLFRSSPIDIREAQVLAPIAYQCMFSGGPAVLLARNLYRSWDKTAQWKHDEYCSKSTSSTIANGLIADNNTNQKIESKSIIGAKDILIYPNPAQDILNINLGNEIKIANLSLRIMNTTGMEIMSQNLDNVNNLLNISTLQNGIYFCIITDKDKVLSTKRLIILK